MVGGNVHTCCNERLVDIDEVGRTKIRDGYKQKRENRKISNVYQRLKTIKLLLFSTIFSKKHCVTPFVHQAFPSS